MDTYTFEKNIFLNVKFCDTCSLKWLNEMQYPAIITTMGALSSPLWNVEGRVGGGIQNSAAVLFRILHLLVVKLYSTCIFLRICETDKNIL